MYPIRINSEEFPIPADLSEITLGKFVSFYDQYGRSLDANLANILERKYEDEVDRDLDLSSHEDQEALYWFSFWTGLDLTSVQTADALPLLVLYRKIKI